MQKIETLERRLFSHPLHDDPEEKHVYELCEKKEKVCALSRRSIPQTENATLLQLASEVKHTKSQIKKAKTVLLLDQLKCRKRVLRRHTRGTHYLDSHTVISSFYQTGIRIGVRRRRSQRPSRLRDHEFRLSTFDGNDVQRDVQRSRRRADGRSFIVFYLRREGKANGLFR